LFSVRTGENKNQNEKTDRKKMGIGSEGMKKKRKPREMRRNARGTKPLVFQNRQPNRLNQGRPEESNVWY
jgi:hypothetical protein